MPGDYSKSFDGPGDNTPYVPTWMEGDKWVDISDSQLRAIRNKAIEECAAVADKNGCGCHAPDCDIENTANIIAKRIRALAS